MASAYHNLDGWMRDVHRAYEDGGERAYRLAELLILIDDLITDKGRDALLDDAEGTAESVCGDDVDLPDAGDGVPVGRPDEGHASDGPLIVARPARLGAQVGMRRTQDLARRAAGLADSAGPLARASVTTARMSRSGKT